MLSVAETPTRRPGLLPLIVVVGTMGALAFGCAPTRAPTAESTFAEANEYFDSGAYDMAIESYKELLDQHPFTEHASEAETRMARAYYLMGRYPEAIAAFGDFERMHPTSPLVPLVDYYLGMSYLRQMRSSDRDQSASENAHAYFRAVIDRYPDTPWAERASLRLRECEESLAAHELYVAEFYLRQDNLSAAEARLERLLDAYPDTDTAGKALYRFGAAYLDRDLEEPAVMAFLALVKHHPEDPLAQEANAALARLNRLHGPLGNPGADPLELLIRHLKGEPMPADEPVVPGRLQSLFREAPDARVQLPAGASDAGPFVLPRR